MTGGYERFCMYMTLGGMALLVLALALEGGLR